MNSDLGTAERILDAAERMLRTRGFHAFSFRDIASEVGVRAASVHYHFPVKDDLARALLLRARTRFESALAQVEATTIDVRERLRRFAGLFVEATGDADRLCPVCMMAVVRDSVSPAVQDEIETFFLRAEQWLAAALKQGRERGRLAFAGDVTLAARSLVAGLEGAMITTRVFGDRRRVAECVDFLLGSVGCPPEVGGRQAAGR